MSSAVRRAAGLLTILEGMWLSYMYFSVTPVNYACPLNVCPYPAVYLPDSPAFLVLGLALVVAGALGLWGASFAFVGGMVLSVLAVIVAGYSAAVASGYLYLPAELDKALVGMVVAAVALALNVVAMRRKERLSEQANPMNLPVFG